MFYGLDNYIVLDNTVSFVYTVSDFLSHSCIKNLQALTQERGEKNKKKHRAGCKSRA